MGWMKAFGGNFVSGMMGDKKSLRTSLRCPFGMCPSNQPFVGALRTKMKFIERISPYVYAYRCKHCGCKVNVSADGPKIPQQEKPYVKNPNLIIRRDLQ